MVTTIPAGTLRLLLTSISYRAKARKRDAARAANGSAPPVPGRKHNARLMPGQPGAMLMPGVGSIETPPGWHGLRCCIVWHGSITGAHRCTLIYLIIIGGCADLCSVPAWRWYLVSVEGVRARVCPPAWRKWHYIRLCRSGIVNG